jgi:hypothetical protein
MFKQWCTSTTTNVSHVLLDGGKLSVPFDTLDDFYDTYIKAVTSGEKLYVVEQKTETYNFFVDIDYKSEDPLGIDDIKDVCTLICEEVRKHSQVECLISVALPKVCGSLVKTGVHMNWYGLVVGQVSAIALREHIVLALAGRRDGKDWNDIIDASVYGNAVRRTKGSGFRMPWSFKRAKHEACGGQGCDGCTHGKVDQVEYLPLFVYTKQPLSTLMRIDQTPSVDILKMSAVRTNAPENVTIEPPSVSVKEGSFSNDQTKDELYDQALKNMIETFVRTHMEGQSDAYVTKVFRHKETFLVSTTSRYCENLKRRHNSNHVWFIISGKMIAQKCFCRCETIQGRRDGFCKDFCGRQHELSQSVVDRLYPNKGVLSACPEIKKYEDKPRLKQSDVTPPLETFIRTAFRCDVKIVSVTKIKKQYTVLTTSHYCETIGEDHEDKAMSYVIEGKIITQKCPVCRKSTSRKHELPHAVVKVLKQ